MTLTHREDALRRRGPVIPAERRSRPGRPVVGWAVVGVGFLVVGGWAMSAWVISGDAYATRPVGPEEIGASTRALAWVLQGASVGSGVVAVVYLVNACRWERRITWDTMVALGFLSAYWQDTLINYTRPLLYFNSCLVNLGSWDPHIPGWQTPGARDTPGPLLLTLPMYLWMFMGFSVLVCALARRIHRRWPGIGMPGLFGAGVLAVGLVDLVLEAVLIRSGLYAYGGVIRELSLWGGRPHQFPLYESLLVGVLGSAIGVLRFTRDDRGLSVIERGADRLGDGARRATSLRVLAFCGFVNAIFLAATAVFIGLGFFADPTPRYPSYLTNGLGVVGGDR